MPEELVGRLRDEGWTVKYDCSSRQRGSLEEWHCRADKGNQHADLSYRRPETPTPDPRLAKYHRHVHHRVDYGETPTYLEGEASLTVTSFIDGDEAQRLLDRLHPAEAPLRDFDIEQARRQLLGRGWLVSLITQADSNREGYRPQFFGFNASRPTSGTNISLTFSMADRPPEGAGTVSFREGRLSRSIKGSGTTSISITYEENAISITYEEQDGAEELLRALLY